MTDALDHRTVRVAHVFFKTLRSTVKPVANKRGGLCDQLGAGHRTNLRIQSTTRHAEAHISKCSNTAVPWRSGVVSLNSVRPMDLP